MTGLSTEDRLRWISAHCAELEKDLEDTKAEAVKLKLENMRLRHEQGAHVGDEALRARCDRLGALLSRLVRQLERTQGYSTYDEQQELREARALVAEAGR